MLIAPPSEKPIRENPLDEAPVHERGDEARAKKICMQNNRES